MAAYSRLFKHFRDSSSTTENRRFNQIEIHGTKMFWDKTTSNRNPKDCPPNDWFRRLAAKELLRHKTIAVTHAKYVKAIPEALLKGIKLLEAAASGK